MTALEYANKNKISNNLEGDSIPCPSEFRIKCEGEKECN
jgi:hypothetical protein